MNKMKNLIDSTIFMKPQTKNAAQAKKSIKAERKLCNTKFNEAVMTQLIHTLLLGENIFHKILSEIT